MTKEFRYKGFTSPNGTIVPDDVFDVLAPELSEAELRVLLYVIRKTFGWKKNEDAISVSQMVNGVKTRDGRIMDKGTGMSKSAVWRGANGLVAKGILNRQQSQSENGEYETNVYSLRFFAESDEEQFEEIKSASRGVSLQESNPISAKEPPPLSKRVTVTLQKSTQPTSLQPTSLQQTEINPSNIRMHKNAELIVDNSESQSITPSRTRSSASSPRTESRPDTKRASSVAPGDTAFVSRDQRLPGDPEAIGTVLKRGRGRPPKQPYDEARLHIQAYLQDFARELGDQAPIKSSVSRAYNLYTASGVPLARFIDALYQARAKTQERSASIKSRPDPTQPFAPKAKMAYYFAVVEDELGLREDDATDTASAVNTSRERIAADAER